MRYYIQRRVRILSNCILAETEFGNITVSNRVVTIPQKYDTYYYNYNDDIWTIKHFGLIKPYTDLVVVNYENLVVKNNLFFTILLKNDNENYTRDEREEVIKDYYRKRRGDVCYSVINRGQLWYDHLGRDQKTELNEWYEAWLDVTHTLVEPKTPLWINNKLEKIEVEEFLL